MADVAFNAQFPNTPQVLGSDALDDLENDSEMWNIYLDEVKEEDDRITGAWKEDANGIVVFTGLFSAIVGAFIIEFYKKLSSDSNPANQSSPPGSAMICVNAMWLMSLILSLTCALLATLLQQWARRYIETPKYPNTLRHRARIRSLLLAGTKLYNVPLIVEILPTLLHLSVYLFLGGLAVTFHTIHKKVAIAVDVAVGVSGLAYVALSILPCLDMRCPYRTPISQILWYPCQVFLPFMALCLHRGALGLQYNRQYFTDGLEKSIVSRAILLKAGDRTRFTWLFNQLALGERYKFLKFAASIPRFKIPDLILPVELDEFITLRGSLLALLRSSVAGLGEVEVNRRSLLVCLHAIWHIVKAPTIPDLDFMRAHFANTDLMRNLWYDRNAAIRVLSFSICALLVKQVIRNPLREPQLRWLEDVIGHHAPGTTDVATWDQKNFKSFITHALQGHENDLPTEDAKFFKETLAILLDVRTDVHFDTNFQSRLSAEIHRIREDGFEFPSKVVIKLRSMFPFLSLPEIPNRADSYRASTASYHASTASIPETPALTASYPMGPYPTTPYPMTPYPMAPYPTAPYLAVPYPTAPYPEAPYLTAPYPTARDPTAPYPTVPYPTARDPTVPYPMARDPTVPYPMARDPTAPYPTAPYPTIPYPTARDPTAPYPTVPYPMARDPTAPYPTAPYPTIPYPTARDPTAPYPTARYPMTPYPSWATVPAWADASTQTAIVPTSSTHSASTPAFSTHAASTPASSHDASTHLTSTPAASTQATPVPTSTHTASTLVSSLRHDPLAQV